MAPDHESYCAALTGLSDLCTCGAVHRLALRSVAATGDERRRAPEKTAAQEGGAFGELFFGLRELTGVAG